MRLPLPAVRRIVADWTVPVAILVTGVVDVSLHPHSRDFPGSPAVHVALLTAGVAALGVRRRAPILAPTTAIAVATGWAAVWPKDTQASFEAFLVLVMAAYAIGAGNRGDRLRRGSLALLGYFGLSQLALLLFGGSMGDLLPILVWMGSAWGVGVALNRRTDQAVAARLEAAALAADQERRTAEAVEQERSRIARELHDVVAHGLSVIVVQAAAERRALGHGATDPAATEAVLASVERTGREAMVDLRRLLGLLRRVDEPPALAPQPSLAQIDVLTTPLREAGVDVAVHVEGAATALPPGVDVTAYRIVQEALTNVLKHAGAGRVDVWLRHRPRELEIEVVDDGGGRVVDELPMGGHGLVGMRERTHVFGGSVTAGPRDGGGWSVAARLPVEAAALEPA